MTYIRRCIKEIKIIKYFEYVPKVKVELKKKNIYYKSNHIINNQNLKNSLELDDYEIRYINYIKKNGGL
jgi:hypothetical protein